MDAVERFFPCVFADGVKHHRQFFAAVDLQHALGEILGGVVDGVGAAVGFGERSFLVVRHGADHGDTHCLEPLAGDQADAAGSGVPQHGVPGLDRIRFFDQVLHRHALQHHRRTLLKRNRIGQLHEFLGRHHTRFTISALRAAGIGDAVAGLDVGDARADRFDYACAFSAEARWQRRRVQASTEINVDEIEAHGVMLDARLARARVTDLHFFPFQYFGATGLVKADCVGHVGAPVEMLSTNEVLLRGAKHSTAAIGGDLKAMLQGVDSKGSFTA